MVEGIEQESVLSYLDLEDVPMSLTTTEGNLTGSWKYLTPKFSYKLSPCQNSCPLKNNIPVIVKYIKQDRLDVAVNLLRKTNPIPATLGRICPNFCEKSCSRNYIDENVSIGRIERYLGDIALDIPFPKIEEKNNLKILVIGSGPAGLGAAYFLRRNGCYVKIFEKRSMLGGLLTRVIPEYRLPIEVVLREINKLIQELGIEVELERIVNKDDIVELLMEFDEIIIASGMQKSHIPNKFKGYKNVIGALDILEDIKSKKYIDGDTFYIIGGGNAAMDVARSLTRLGKNVKIIYRRTKDLMPAYKEEIDEAVMENISIIEKTVVLDVIQKEDSLDVKLCKTRLNQDKVEVIGDSWTETVDRVVFAIGQENDLTYPQMDNIYIAGDLSLGPSSVAESIASGMLAAKEILRKHGIIKKESEDDEKVVQTDKLSFEFVEKKASFTMDISIPEELSGNFDEIKKDVTREEFETEVNRCLECGTCTGCKTCWFFCPDICIQIGEVGGGYIANIDLTHCKGCGICSSVCPRGMIEMEED
ncbi:hypothetical protein JCM13304A_07240 [Desulfothermus okinawensis JCM 13304]